MMKPALLALPALLLSACALIRGDDTPPLTCGGYTALAPDTWYRCALGLDSTRVVSDQASFDELVAACPALLDTEEARAVDLQTHDIVLSKTTLPWLPGGTSTLVDDRCEEGVVHANLSYEVNWCGSDSSSEGAVGFVALKGHVLDVQASWSPTEACEDVVCHCSSGDQSWEHDGCSQCGELWVDTGLQ